MPIEILMPALSPTMTEGNLIKWLKKEGDTVGPGDTIAEIETDKATMEVESVDEGTLGKIFVAAGTEAVKVNEVIGLLLEEGEDAKSLESYAPKKSAAPAKDEGKAPTPAKGIPAGTGPKLATAHGDRIFASPLARRIAQEKGVDLRVITGSGPRGRIVKADVERAPVGGGGMVAQTAVAYDGTEFEDVPLTTMRKVIASRLVESKQHVPHFYVTMECQIDDLLRMRKSLNEAQQETKVSVNDAIIKACAIALQRVPAANASWLGNAIRQFKTSDISVAVAIEGGLITPIVKSAEDKGILEISKEVKDLAARAREGTLKPEEFQGGTFSLSNMGMYGVKEFSAIINPPQGCILAVGAGEERPVVREGKIEVATVMNCTLSSDHRVVDGTTGAEFMAAFKNLIENPLLILA